MAPFFLALLHGFPLNAVQQIGVGGHRPVAAVHHHLQCVAFFPQLFHCLTNLSGHLLRTLIQLRLCLCLFMMITDENDREIAKATMTFFYLDKINATAFMSK